jgi:hypothetical protein
LSTLTEEEARKRWCPFVRHSNAPEGSWNRCASSSMDPEHYKCIASECMAFRLMPQTYRHTNSGGSYVGTNKTNGFGVAGEPLPRQGYCGLAGKPA